ncbi:hypothetical protein [Nocardioides aquiterrae]|uniref:Uncharacterized protein n=1 Tax=Nocardioides aquiterrae TaxID=203799 RepID=A0ABN1U6K1_9ACTN
MPDATYVFPAGFEELAEFSDWCISRDEDRIAKRLDTAFPETVAFYDAVLPHVARAMSYLSTRPVENCSVEDTNLVNLLKTMAEMANAVEIYHQGAIPDAGDLRLYTSSIDADLLGSDTHG